MRPPEERNATTRARCDLALHSAVIRHPSDDLVHGMLEMSVYVVERQATGDHQHLRVIEELRQLFGSAVAALMLGGHPCLGCLFHELLADRVRAPLEELSRPRPGGSHCRPLAEPREERLKRQVLPCWRSSLVHQRERTGPPMQVGMLELSRVGTTRTAVSLGAAIAASALSPQPLGPPRSPCPPWSLAGRCGHMPAHHHHR